jgi:YidC/Oxa1 family membrane protein insertase
MNDIRRSVLWVIFGFCMVMLWDKWQVYNGHKALFFPTTDKVEATSGVQARGGVTDQSAIPQASSLATDSLNSSAAFVSGRADVSNTFARSKIEITTNVLKLTFDPLGASLVRAELLAHKDVNHPGQNVVVLNDSAERVYEAQSGLISKEPAVEFPTHKTLMRLSGETTFAAGQNKLTLRFESPQMGGLVLVKSYEIDKDSYELKVREEVFNKSDKDVSPLLYVQLLRDGNKPEGESSFYSTFTGPAVYTEAKKYQKIDFKDIEKDKLSFEKQSDEGFVAMVQHYFVSAWVFSKNTNREYFARKVDTNLYSVGMITPFNKISSNSSAVISADLYVGPQEEKTLEAIYPGLELVKDYGWLTILAKPLYWLIDKLHDFIGNWGWSIVALVVLLKLAFFWLNAQAYKSMAKMKAINPKIMEMRERLKDNPQQIQVEMMKIYREEKVNPMGGCLPIVIQIPVFIALYWVLLSTVEMRNAPWLGWIHDLAAPDPYFILPVVMTATSLLQTWLNPTPPDPIQAKMMWIMPLAFSVMFFFFPSGLVLYWLTNNILSISQQWLINKKLGVLN